MRLSYSSIAMASHLKVAQTKGSIGKDPIKQTANSPRIVVSRPQVTLRYALESAFAQNRVMGAEGAQLLTEEKRSSHPSCQSR